MASCAAAEAQYRFFQEDLPLTTTTVSISDLLANTATICTRLPPPNEYRPSSFMRRLLYRQRSQL